MSTDPFRALTPYNAALWVRGRSGVAAVVLVSCGGWAGRRVPAWTRGVP